MKIKTVIAINIATGLSIGSIANSVYGQQSANIGSIVVNDKATTIKERMTNMIKTSQIFILVKKKLIVIKALTLQTPLIMQ